MTPLSESNPTLLAGISAVTRSLTFAVFGMASGRLSSLSRRSGLARIRQSKSTGKFSKFGPSKRFLLPCGSCAA